MLTPMKRVGLLLREVRCGAGLSARALAERADVSTSTITRIENGHSDVTVGMLARLLAATGNELNIFPTPGPRIVDLTDAWTPGRREPVDGVNFVRLRSFIDYLRLNPAHTGAAIATPPQRTGSLFMDSLLAGIAETLADGADIEWPSWTSHVPGLDQPYIAPGPARIQKLATAHTSRPLQARGLVIDDCSLWRTRELVDV